MVVRDLGGTLKIQFIQRLFDDASVEKVGQQISLQPRIKDRRVTNRRQSMDGSKTAPVVEL